MSRAGRPKKGKSKDLRESYDDLEIEDLNNKRASSEETYNIKRPQSRAGNFLFY